MLCLKGRKAECSLFRDVSVIVGGEIESELEFASGFGVVATRGRWAVGDRSFVL